MLTQSEADELITLPKKAATNQVHFFPNPGNHLSIPLSSQDDKEKFLIDVNRGRIKLTQCTYQERYRVDIVLIRLDIDGRPHTNPDGKELPCPHLHLYREGFDVKWAIPAPVDKFGNIKDLFKTTIDFLKYCNVINPPKIQTVL